MPPSKTSARNLFSDLPAGLGIASLSLEPGGHVVIAERDEYAYYCYRMKPGQTVSIDHLACASVFVPEINDTLEEITVNGLKVAQGDTALAERTPLTITATKGSGYVLIAGSIKSTPGATPQLVVCTAAHYHRVNKPWGHEFWINGEHPVYSFKGIVVKQGAQTSLQYHQYKTEVALLCKGTMELVHKANAGVKNDDVQPGDLAVVRLNEMGTVAVEPHTLHRMRGATDIYYYEISTPHLDDVIRVQDDNKRGHGRILEEHMAS